MNPDLDPTFLPPGALMGWGDADRGRTGLGIDRWKLLRRFETEPAAPESWTQPAAVCSCGRCDGRGALFITTSGAEEWRPHRPDGRTGYLPEAAAGDRWKR